VLLLLRRGQVAPKVNASMVERLRKDARNDEIATREREAEALRTRADADRAKADELDPNIDTANACGARRRD
jgi:hypothetical protein